MQVVGVAAVLFLQYKDLNYSPRRHSSIYCCHHHEGKCMVAVKLTVSARCCVWNCNCSSWVTLSSHKNFSDFTYYLTLCIL